MAIFGTKVVPRPLFTNWTNVFKEEDLKEILLDCFLTLKILSLKIFNLQPEFPINFSFSGEIKDFTLWLFITIICFFYISKIISFKKK